MLKRLTHSLVTFGSSRSSIPAHAALDRRGFLRLAAGSTLLVGAACAGAAGEEQHGGLGGGAGGKADNLEFDENGMCLSGTTGGDALGPYWTPNIRQTNQLASAGEPGQRIVVMGHVYARDCLTAIPNATIVAWQADDQGLYDYNHAGLNQGTSQGVLDTSQTNLRGWFASSATGTYTFETVLPSEYPLNLLDPANSAYRAPHIHYAVFWTDSLGARHQLVTQMYFAPNNLIKTRIPDIDRLNASDFGASTAESSRFISIDGSTTDIWHGQFDLVLDVSPSSV
jgi:protocatechuate 3,4-dioxygenase beta subunit